MTVGPRSFAAVVALTVAAFLLRLAVVWTEHPLGTDGYYYVVQIEDWAALGRLHVPDSSWVLRVLALPHLLGLDPVASLAVAACGLAALVTPAAWALGAQRSETHAWLLAILAAGSPTLTHLTADFPKNLGAVAPLVGLLAALVAARRGSRRAWGVAVVLALLAATAHRLGAVFVGLIIASLVVQRLSLRAWLLAGLGVSGFAAASALLPSLLHPADLHRLDGQLRAVPWPLAPLGFLPLRPFHAVQVAELGAAWLALCAAPRAWRHDRPGATVASAWLLVALFPFWSHDSLDLGYRLLLMAPLGGWAMLAALPAPTAPPRPALLGAATLWLGAAPLSFDPSLTPPYDRYDQLITRIPRPLPALVIAHRGINFLYDHRTGAEAMAWAPDDALDPTTVGRIAWGIRPGEWASVLQAHHPAVVSLGADYHYVREDLWQALLAEAEATDDDGLLARMHHPNNPHRQRPSALTRGR